MKTRLLTIAMAIASVFAVQVGVASAKHNSNSTKKHHHSKNMKKSSGTKLTTPAAPGRS